MNIVGIDISTYHIDIVKIPLDGPGATWHRFPLTGSDAFDRARSVADTMPGRASVFWDDVLAIGIEHPAGKYGVGPLLRIQGAVLTRIPPHTLVEHLPPSKWRAQNGLKGNATKDEVKQRSFDLLGELALLAWPQDAHDAHLIAQATRKLLAHQDAA